MEKIPNNPGESECEASLHETNEEEYLTAWKLVPVTIGLCLNVFALSLDNTIITTAIPRITDQFHSLGDVGWYGSVYFLTTCAVTLVYGRLYTFFSIKWVYLSALLVFEVGSLICGAAPTSAGLIFGRGIAGLGGGGLLSGSLLITAYSVPLHKRPFYIGIVSSVYGIASVIGPLLGGALTDHASWRWCFYINLPLGVVPALVIYFFYKPRPVKLEMKLTRKLLRLDPIGNLLFIAAVVCLLLAIQWGGVDYPWNNAHIIALFALSGVLGLGFAALQWWKKDDAILPARVLKKRGVWGSAWFMFFLGGGYYSFQYYLPVWFQAIKNQSATMSGVMNLPMILALSISSILTGCLIMKVGYYKPFMILGVIVTTIGAGMLTTLHPNSGPGQWIGYQALLGIGIGTCVQLPLTIVQSVNTADDIPIATAFMTFIQTLGATIFLAVSQNVLQGFLIRNIDTDAPSVNADAVLSGGITDLRRKIPPSDLPAVIHAYNHAIMETFYVSVACSGLAIVGVLVLEWQSVNRKKTETTVA